MEDVDSNALEVIVKYAYTYQVEMSEDNVQAVLSAANLLQLPNLKDECCKFLSNCLSPENCIGIKFLADHFICSNLQQESKTYIENNFAKVVDGQEFYDLKPDQVCEIIASDTINIPNEEKVYETVISWVKHNAANRSQHLPTLIKHVRLSLMSHDYLLKVAKEEPLFQENDAASKLINEALMFHQNESNMEPSALALLTKQRKKKVILVMGSRSVCYSFKDDYWVPHYPNYPDNQNYDFCSIVVVKGLVYAFGNGGCSTNSVVIYDPNENTWSSGPNMTTKHKNMSAAVVDDCIYVIDGISVEVLDLSGKSRLPEWRTISKISFCFLL